MRLEIPDLLQGLGMLRVSRQSANAAGRQLRGALRVAEGVPHNARVHPGIFRERRLQRQRDDAEIVESLDAIRGRQCMPVFQPDHAKRRIRDRRDACLEDHKGDGDNRLPRNKTDRVPDRNGSFATETRNPSCTLQDYCTLT